MTAGSSPLSRPSPWYSGRVCDWMMRQKNCGFWSLLVIRKGEGGNKAYPCSQVTPGGVPQELGPRNGLIHGVPNLRDTVFRMMRQIFSPSSSALEDNRTEEILTDAKRNSCVFGSVPFRKPPGPNLPSSILSISRNLSRGDSEIFQRACRGRRGQATWYKGQNECFPY